MSSFPYLFLYFRFKIISYTHIKNRLKESLLIPILLSLPKPLPAPNTLYHSIFFLTTAHYTPHTHTHKTTNIFYSNKQSSLLHLFNHHNTFYLSLHSNIIYQMSLYQIPPHHSLSPRKNHTSKRNPSIHCPSNHSFSRSNTNLGNNFNINHMKSTSSSLD